MCVVRVSAAKSFAAILSPKIGDGNMFCRSVDVKLQDELNGKHSQIGNQQKLQTLALRSPIELKLRLARDVM